MKKTTARNAVICMFLIVCSTILSGCSSPKPVDGVNPALSPEQKARMIDKKQKADQ